MITLGKSLAPRTHRDACSRFRHRQDRDEAWLDPGDIGRDATPHFALVLCHLLF